MRLLVALGILFAALGLAACGHTATPATPPPAKVSVDRGIVRIVLTPQAADRIGVRTAVTQAQPRTGRRVMRTAIPYAAVLYAPDGSTFTYVNPAPFVYVKTPIVIDHITGGRALLGSGPAPGTRIVIVGGDELLGVEDGVQK
ncbi:MAG: hypothetical protein ACYDHH_24300 [Solirubrobacteraceae bacterium]